MTVTASPQSGQQGTIGDAPRLKAAGGISPWWVNWVDRHRVAGIALVGVIATQLGTYFGYVFPAVGLPTVPWPLYNGALGLLGKEFNTPGSFFVGQTLHYVNGIVFAILYAVLFLPLMPFRNTRGQPPLRDHLHPDHDGHQHRLPGPVRLRTAFGLRVLQLLWS
jgi:hypothetical protein